jgi:UDP-glucose 4-epimerase
MAHIFNVYYPEPVTIIDLAEICKEAIVMYSKGRIQPEINLVDTGQPILFDAKDKSVIKVDVNKALSFLDIEKLKSPKESIETIVKSRIKTD